MLTNYDSESIPLLRRDLLRLIASNIFSQLFRFSSFQPDELAVLLEHCLDSDRVQGGIVAARVGSTKEVAKNTDCAVQQDPGKVYCAARTYRDRSAAECSCLPDPNGNPPGSAPSARASLSHQEGADGTTGSPDNRGNAEGVSSGREIEKRASRCATDSPGDHQLALINPNKRQVSSLNNPASMTWSIDWAVFTRWCSKRRISSRWALASRSLTELMYCALSFSATAVGAR